MSANEICPPSQERGGAWPLGWCVAVAALEGTGVMIVELGAARLLTPYFGSSQYVWTNIIGVVLAAIALGNFVGGLIADRWPKSTLLAGLLALAAILSAVSPWWLRPIASSFVDAAPEFEWAFEFLAKGSFITTVFVFAPPVFVLGMTLPFIVKFSCHDPSKVGSRAGAVYAASTLGSIGGTFLTSYVLISEVGGARTFAIAACVISAAAIMTLIVGHRFSKKNTIASVALLLLVGITWSTPASFEEDETVLFAQDSRYQFVRVIEKEPGRRLLCLNEGLDSFHSITIENQLSTDGQYYDYLNLLVPLATQGDTLRVAILGSAAGTQARQIFGYFGDSMIIKIDGVEIDPLVTEVGYEFLGLQKSPNLQIHSMDGRAFLRFVKEPYNLIVIDAYAKQAYIPFHMATQEFFESVDHALRPRGVVGINVSAFSRGDPVLRGVVNTMAKVFGTVVECKIPMTRNYMVYAMKGAEPPLPNLESLPNHEDLHEDLVSCASAFENGRGIVQRTYDPSLSLLTDDWAPIESLEDNMLRKRAKRMTQGR